MAKVASFLIKPAKVMLFAFCVGVVAWLCFSSVYYASGIGYFDHAEPNIASVAAFWLRGFVIYHTKNSPYIYSLLYGPLPVLINALFQQISFNTIVASKIPGVIALIAGLICFYFALIKNNISSSKAVVALALLCLGYCYFTNTAYWDRPDSYILLFVSLALWLLSVDTNISIFKVVAIGLCVGSATACKIHGSLYFIPFLVLILTTHAKDPLRNQKTALLLGAAALGAFWMFILHGIDLKPYIFWLCLATKQGLLFHSFKDNVQFAIPLLLAVGACYAFDDGIAIFASFAICILLLCIIGAKPGAGTHHIMPMIPVAIFLTALRYERVSVARRRVAQLAAIALVGIVVPTAIHKQLRLWHYLRSANANSLAAQEIKKIISSNSGLIAMGYTSDKQVRPTFLMPMLVAKKNGILLIDAAALMDMEFSGLKISKAALDNISKCKIPTIVLPKYGKPWTITNWYNGAPLFSSEWQSTFQKVYKLKRVGEYFSIYKCTSKSIVALLRGRPGGTSPKHSIAAPATFHKTPYRTNDFL